MKIVFSPKVEDYLFELIEILYDKEYFGFKESATSYVKELIQEYSRKHKYLSKENSTSLFR